MPKKPKTTQPETINKIQGRDLFQTPNYATSMLIPFIPKNVKYVWECAAGNGKIVQCLYKEWLDDDGKIIPTDINNVKYSYLNFLLDVPDFNFDCIITNPPFSLKKKFYERCKSYNFPFALLLPADYTQWVIDAIRFDGAEKIIPSRRIDYITPNGNQGETSSSQFHSMWLTSGFKIGKSEGDGMLGMFAMLDTKELIPILLPVTVFIKY